MTQYILLPNGFIAVNATNEYFCSPILIKSNVASALYDGPTFEIICKNQWDLLCESVSPETLENNSMVSAIYHKVRDGQEFYDDHERRMAEVDWLSDRIYR